MPSICFSTGKEHTDAYYVAKVREIFQATGRDVIISIKNYAGLGTPKRIGQLAEALCQAFRKSSCTTTVATPTATTSAV